MFYINLFIQIALVLGVCTALEVRREAREQEREADREEDLRMLENRIMGEVKSRKPSADKEPTKKEKAIVRPKTPVKVKRENIEDLEWTTPDKWGEL